MKYIIITIYCTLFTAVQAQTILNLDRAIEIATQSSLETFRVKNMYLASYWEYRNFKANRLPRLDLNMNPLQYNQNFVKRYDSQNNIDIFKVQQTINSWANLSLVQNVDFTGGTLFFDSELAYMKNFGSDPFSQFSTVPLRIGYRQSLFGFNSFKWEKKIEPVKFESAKRELIQNMEQISETVTSYFFDLALSQRLFDMATSELATSDTLYNIGKKRYQIAAIAKADLLTLQLDKVNALNNLKRAELDLKRSKFQLTSYLGIDENTDMEVILPTIPRPITATLEEAIAHAKDHSPKLLQLKQRTLQAEMSFEKTARENLFTASVSASVGFNQVANEFAKAYKDPLRQDMVSVSLNIPIIDWGLRKGKYQMAKNNLEVVQSEVAQNVLSFEQQVMMTYNELMMQQEQLAGSQEAIHLADFAYDDTKKRFLIGKADVNAMSLALNRKNNAERNYISSLKSYWVSYYALRKLTLYDYLEDIPIGIQFDHTMNIR